MPTPPTEPRRSTAATATTRSVHYYRYFASTITTGSGSDTIELAYANQGTAAIIVTDFTAGAGGDMFRLSGDDGALLSLLSGWDGSSNPFGSGFLRLQQSGADTLLQWDQDGAAGGANWETLVVFQNTDAGDFTDANFVPGYDPDGSAPAGETITGTEDDDTLTGTIGGDTINALGGDDTVFGLAGADHHQWRRRLRLLERRCRRRHHRRRQ